MLPRGEVGLIFATIGLQTGVLGDDLYAALLLVVLVTTLVTPQLLKIRYGQLRRDPAHLAPAAGDPMPVKGWLSVVDGVVVLNARPPAHLGLELAFGAAVLMTRARPSTALLDWLSTVDPRQLKFTSAAVPAFLSVVEKGDARSWRFLDTLGVLETAVPELSQALRERAADPFELDPGATHRWTTIERLRAIDAGHPLAAELERLAHPEWLFLAALLTDAVGDRSNAVTVARLLAGRLATRGGGRAGDRPARRGSRPPARGRPPARRDGGGFRPGPRVASRHARARPQPVRAQCRAGRSARTLGVRTPAPTARARAGCARPS